MVGEFVDTVYHSAADFDHQVTFAAEAFSVGFSRV
jgi:hypothetical protein